MPEQTAAPIAEGPQPGTKDWARKHREAIQQRVKIRASNASSLMQEIEKIRPYGDEDVVRRGRKPKIDPRTEKPFAHVLLGFGSWREFVSTAQPEGLGWSPDHERTMWNGWVKIKKAGITTDMVDELGQAWLSDVGANRNSAAKGLSVETAQAQIDEKRARAADPAKKRRQQRKADEERPAAKGLPGPSGGKAGGGIMRRDEAAKGAPLSTARTPKAMLNAFLESIAPGIEPKSALKVSQAVIPHLEPADMFLVAKEVVPKLESEHIGEILKGMVNALDAEESAELARSVVRRLQTADLERIAKDVGELIAARKGRDGAKKDDTPPQEPEDDGSKPTDEAKPAGAAPKPQEATEPPAAAEQTSPPTPESEGGGGDPNAGAKTGLEVAKAAKRPNKASKAKKKGKKKRK